MRNTILDNFSKWMIIHRNLSSSSIEKYTRAVNTISNDMLELGVINESLLNMGLTELDLSIALILRNPQFIKKNTIGNHMYSNGLKQFRCFAFDTVDSIDEKEIKIIESIKSDKAIEKTAKEALVKSRVGQGDFRKSLVEKYDGKCVVTGIDLTKLLIASHIKPWRISDNKERLSSENGLLLSANLDKLFDSGLITFMNDGTLVPSQFINQQNRTKLGLNDDIKVDLKASSDMFINLEYHRDVIFVA